MQTEAVKRLLVGRPMASGQMDDTLLSKFLALPVFASDPLSSVAYATEAALVVLVGASATAGHLVFPVSIAISLLLAIVVISYTQTVRAYETSGGAYIVAKDNLGTLPSLVAGAALLTDYILTVAVSVAAGIVAITSAAPSLDPYRVWLCLACIVALTVANLRGVREAGWLFAIPTYGFVISLFAVIGTGVAKCATARLPAGDGLAPGRCGDRSGDDLRPPARLRVGLGCTDRRRVDLERRRPRSSARSRRMPPRRSRSWARSRSRCSSACHGSP